MVDIVSSYIKILLPIPVATNTVISNHDVHTHRNGRDERRRKEKENGWF